MAVVSGRLQTRNWTDKEGNKRKATEIVAESVYFGDSKREELQNYAAPQESFAELPDDGDIPF